MNLFNNFSLLAVIICAAAALIVISVGFRKAVGFVKQLTRQHRLVRRSSFAIAAILLLGVLLIMFIPRHISAQPYFTNSTTQNGPYQYNDKAVPALLITTVRSNQVYAGIYTGTFGGTATTNVCTNSFGHTFANPPVVTANFTNYGGNPATPSGIVITNITTTNFAAVYIATNAGGNWIAIGAP